MKKNNQSGIAIIGVALLVLMLGAVGYFLINNDLLKRKPAEIKDATLKLKWVHQAQFAGNYIAKEKGFYEDEGINLNIEPFSFEDHAIDSVTKGDADFGITSAAELLLARADGKPIKALAVIFKISPECAYSLKKNGITKPQDFIGKTIGVEPGVSGEWLYYLMMSKLGIDRGGLEEIEIGYDATELLEGRTDVSLGYVINEPHQAIESGEEVNIILFAEYGVNMYADVLFATDDMISTNPDMVDGFVDATLKGWRYAIENEKEAVEATLKYATDSTKSHETYMLNQAIPLIHTGDSSIGKMEKVEWEKAQQLLLDQGQLKKAIDIEKSYTTEFVGGLFQ